jgi:hypothetical protein
MFTLCRSPIRSPTQPPGAVHPTRVRLGACERLQPSCRAVHAASQASPWPAAQGARTTQGTAGERACVQGPPDKTQLNVAACHNSWGCQGLVAAGGSACVLGHVVAGCLGVPRSHGVLPEGAGALGNSWVLAVGRGSTCGVYCRCQAGLGDRAWLCAVSPSSAGVSFKLHVAVAGAVVLHVAPAAYNSSWCGCPATCDSQGGCALLCIGHVLSVWWWV